MKIFKKILVTLPLIVLLTASIIPFAASAINARFYDGANVISEANESALAEKLDSLSTKLGHDIVALTVESLDGKIAEKYAMDYFNNGAYGTGDTKSGVILLVCTGSRDYSISAYGDAADILGDRELRQIEDEFLPYLESDNYYEAFCAYADKCSKIIENDGKLSPVWIFVSLTVGAAVAGIAIWCMTAKHKSVKMQKGADTYMKRETFRLERSRDIFLYSHVSRVPRPKSSSSGSGRSSGGRSYSSRSGKF